MNQDNYTNGYSAAVEGYARVSQVSGLQNMKEWYAGFDDAVRANQHPRLTKTFSIRRGFTVGFITREERSAA